MASTASGSKPAQPAAPLNLAMISRFKPAKIYQQSTEPVLAESKPPNAPPGARPPPASPRHANHITGITFDDHGDTLVTAGEDETFRLYNCKTGKHMKTLYSKKYGVDLPRFTHKNTTIVYASTKEDDTIRYHSLHDNKYLQYFKGHKKKVVSLEVCPTDDGFMSGSEDNTVRLWDLRSPTCRGILNTPSTPVVTYDCTGLIFAVGLNAYQRILLYDTKNYDKEPFLTIHLDDNSLKRESYPPRVPVMTSLSFSTNGRWLLVGTAGNGHYILDSFEGGLLAKLEGFEGLERGKTGEKVGVVPVRGISGEEVSWTPDSKYVVGGSYNGKVHFWDIGAAEPLAPTREGQDPKKVLPAFSLDGHPGPSRCVKFNPRFAMICSAGQELVSSVIEMCVFLGEASDLVLSLSR
ncbi:hypothetical protein BOTBODRAFT_157653 [Botryobasidium botryosum FD-172 SS1]|uniref:Uncharacterized protein n=1 Tax=Botryobasidium botryosum (strain FD-172 SS1) TaxID=930990 RepID=A0A067MJF2_BOTB1|nr:hypothetical protein BOTBODRAFT_157653 [Botryobasidium botryosum FD-172 SS1]